MRRNDHVFISQTMGAKEALIAETRKKQDPEKLDVISVAFVTFEHEESKLRCLEDYRYSQTTFGRYVMKRSESPKKRLLILS